MKDGFVKVASISTEVKVADCKFNREKIIDAIKKANDDKILIALFPELAVTAYTCGDLFLRSDLLREARVSILEIAKATKNCDVISVVGAPVDDGGILYNCACVLYHGEILGIVPKKNIPNYSEFYEKRYFSEGVQNKSLNWDGIDIKFGTNLIFKCRDIPTFRFGIEICEDLWVPNSPSIDLAMNGANMILNASASNEVIGKSGYRRQLVLGQSAKLNCAYVFASAGEGESTSDLVFSGHNMIAELGSMLAESELFTSSCTTAFVDLGRIEFERRRMASVSNTNCFESVYFNVNPIEYDLRRIYDRKPFVPDSVEELEDRCSLMLNMQVNALVQRVKHLGHPKLVLGISGGLDSTLALIVCVKAMKKLSRDVKDVIAITMPCFGTTNRTLNNAKNLVYEYGATFFEVNISKSVEKHFEDIGLNVEEKGVAYENAQARERTQVLMDIANKEGGFVVGTGDLSELAMGYTTYNGDHMSMYSVNCSVPKTLMREIVKYESNLVRSENNQLAQILEDIVATPISPELLPPVDGEKPAQKTEQIIGPYELTDFYLYYYLRFGFSREKVLRIAIVAFNGVYSREVLEQRLNEFIRRFYSQQFKRSCAPDGPKLGEVALSPRGDLRIPSDVSWSI